MSDIEGVVDRGIGQQGDNGAGSSDGHNGSIGSVMAMLPQATGHDVLGLDSLLFVDCTHGLAGAVPTIPKDLRDVGSDDLRGVDATAHVAALPTARPGTSSPSTPTT